MACGNAESTASKEKSRSDTLAHSGSTSPPKPALSVSHTPRVKRAFCDKPAKNAGDKPTLPKASTLVASGESPIDTAIPLGAGKWTWLNFWAGWCGPCKKEMPHVKELNEKLAAKGFAVVGVSLDKDQEALAAYLAENQIPWENLAGDETQELAQKYGVRGIPTMMAIGKDGKILGVAHNVASLVPLIEKALAAK